MSKGFGNIGKSPRFEPGGGGGGVTGANNGLSLSGANVQLGGANPLLHATSINLDAFVLDFTKNGDRLLELNPVGRIYAMGDLDGTGNGMSLNIYDDANRLISFGDEYFIGNGLSFEVNDAANSISADIEDGKFTVNKFSNSRTYFNIDNGTHLFQMGDIDGLQGGMLLTIEDHLYRTILMGDIAGIGNSSSFEVNDIQKFITAGVAAAGGHFTVEDLNISEKYLDIDSGFRIVSLGDLSGGGSSTKIIIKDGSNSVELSSSGTTTATLAGPPGAESFIVNLAAGPYLSMSLSSHTFEIGDVNFNHHGNKMLIDDTNDIITLRGGFNIYLSLDQGNGVYQMGDVSGNDSGNIMNVNDTLSKIQAKNITTGQIGLDLSFIARTYTMGDTQAIDNHTMIFVDDMNSSFSASSANKAGLLLSFATNQYSIGDIQTKLNKTTINVNDTLGRIEIDNAAHTAGILINGVAGFTGTVTPVTSITVNHGIVTNVT